ncbi:MAG: alpha/beta fold hydrolase [Alphaproteobacteria bacterium]|nr:alpha/beta fold hydrolase [Alphaproteobacteria bacterium]
MSKTSTKTEFQGSQGKLAAALELPSGRPRAFALFAHCFSCSKDIKAAREIARALRAEGFAVLRFDFTGLGGSEGDFANTNFSSNIEDLVKAADFLRAEFEAPKILVGHSLGGAAMLIAAARMPEARAVVTIGAPAEAAHILKQIGEGKAVVEREGRAEAKLGARPFLIKKQFIDDLKSHKVIDAAASLKKALLVMHAPRDAVVGVENATEIFVAAKHPKSFISLDDADHLLSNAKDARYAATVIAAWAGRYIGVAPGLVEPREAEAAPPIEDGARAVVVPSRPLAAALSIDGHAYLADVPAEEGGENLGPSPTRLLEAALASCGLITMRMYAARKGWPLTEASVDIRRAQGQDSHAALAFEKIVRVGGALDGAQRERLREIADRCPVHRILAAEVKIASRLE